MFHHSLRKASSVLRCLKKSLQCLKHTNEKLVRKTVVRMPPKYVAQFLQLIVNKFQVYLLSDTQLSYNPNFIH